MTQHDLTRVFSSGHMHRSLFLAALLASLALGCRRDKVLGPIAPSGPLLASDQVFRTNATVRFLGIEGGCWALETPAGTYQPTSLPDQFRRDGLRVYVIVRGTRLASFCQIGQLVAVDSIRSQ